MTKQTTYEILCQPKDEKTLATRVDEFLATLDRSMSKNKSKSMLEARLPHRIKHFYMNLNKEVGSYFEIFPNEDLDGNFFAVESSDCAWILIARLDTSNPNFDATKSPGFISNVLDATGFEHTVLEEIED